MARQKLNKADVRSIAARSSSLLAIGLKEKVILKASRANISPLGGTFRIDSGTLREGQETAYGFEVQPIQEYFAAAYISNRLANGKAHEVFESLIHKDYWREVALFLAGLRRPNERADLVARAKGADADVAIPAYQSGRAIILQLLREGVLSQPRHVQTEAMRFAMGFLEARILRVHRTPIDLINSLSKLSQQYGNDETHKDIAKIAQECSQSDDHFLVSLIHRMAGNVLPKDKYIQLVLGHSGMAPETRALVRITRPFNVRE